MSPKVDPSIFIGTNRSYDASIPSFLCRLVGSLHIWIPNFWHWFGFISDFSILFTNHKPCTNSSITTSPESSAKAVKPLHICTFICSDYSGSNRYIVQSSDVNDIGQNCVPKQRESVWLSISVDDAIQITLSLFWCTLWIIGQSLVLILNTVMFSFLSGKRSVSQDIVTRLPRWL